MGKIPTGRVRAGASRPSGFVPSTRASASDFDGSSTAVGSALQNLASGLGQLGETVDDANRRARERREREELANLNAQSDPTPAIIAARDASAPDGSDLYENTKSAYQQWLSDTANDIEDGNVRSAFREFWQEKAPKVASTAALQADAMYENHSRFQLGQSLSALENRVRIDPEAYDDVLQLGYDAMEPHARLNTEQSRKAWQQQVARSRFEALIETAQQPGDLDALRAELASGEWQEVLSPSDFDDTVDAVEARRADIRRGSVTTARAFVTDITQRTADMQPIDRGELASLREAVDATGDPGLTEELARASRDQYLLRTYGSAGPDRLSAMASAMRTPGSVQGVHPQVASAIDGAVSYARGRVPAGYLAAVANMEYGAYLHGDDPDFSKQSLTSSATGLYQFTEATWLSVVRSEGDALVPGVSGKTDAELLAMRSDPGVSAKAAAALAVRNSEQMEAALSRPVTEFEMYLAHFLGAGKAVQMVRAYETDETQSAPDLFPAEAGANEAVFYEMRGDTVNTPRTVRQVYEALSSRFSTTPGRVQHGDAEYIERMRDTAEKRVKDNMMGYARETGVAAVPPLSEEGGAASRANAARIVSNQWGIPMDRVKPLEPQEVAHYQNILSSRDAADKAEVMALFAGMGPTLAQAAYKQLGVEGRVYAHGAGLLHVGGDASAVNAMVDGQTFIDNNPEFMKASGLDRQQVLDQFGTQVAELTANMGEDAATGGAWQAVLDAATAHYVHTSLRRGVQGLDADAFERSLNFALGGTDAAPAIYEYNGGLMVLPNGVTPDAFEDWAYYAQKEDWTALSVRGLPARYGNGDEVPVETLRGTATFEAVGSGRFRVKVDGQYLVTGRDTRAGPELWVVEMNSAGMRRSTEQGQQRVDAAALSVPASSYLVREYGFAWAYDTQGNALPQEEVDRRREEARQHAAGVSE